MRKFKIFCLLVVFVVVNSFFNLVLAQSKREELKKQFMPSSNIRQIQNILIDSENDSYDQSTVA